MKYKILFLILSVTFLKNVSAQSSFLKMLGYDTVTTQNPSVDFNSYNLTPIPGIGGYYVSMITDYHDVSRTTIIKTDSDFNPLWAKRFSGNNFLQLNADSNGVLYISSFTMTNPHTLNPATCLAKLDSSGNLLYVSLYSGADFLSVHQTTIGIDGNLFISGITGPNSMVFTGKIDSSTGQMLWLYPSGSYDIAMVMHSPSGAIYTVNTIHAYNHTNTIVKLNADGTNSFSKYYKKALISTNRFVDVIVTYGNQLKILAQTTDTLHNDQLTSTVLTLDTLGNLISQFEFYSPIGSANSYMMPIRIFEKSPGHFCVVAAELNDMQSDPSYNFLVFEFDTSNNVTQSYAYHDTLQMGNDADRSFIFPDGSLLVSGNGWTSGTVAQFVTGPAVHKLLPDYTSDCNYRPDTIEVRQQQAPFQLVNSSTGNSPLWFYSDTVDVNRFSMTDSPIWTFDGCSLINSIESGEGLTNDIGISVNQKQLTVLGDVKVPARLSIYNSLGQKVFEKQFSSFPAITDLSALPTGSYILLLQSSGGRLMSGKFILQ